MLDWFFDSLRNKKFTVCHRCWKPSSCIKVEEIFGGYILRYDWECKKCYTVQKIISKKLIEEHIKEEQKQKDQWIKERDKLLENKK